MSIPENGEKPCRRRRSDISLERDIMEATRVLVEEVGFSNITLTGVMQRAGVEPQVFYKRYADLDTLFEQFTRKYDYWMTDIMDVESVGFDPEAYYRTTLNNLIKALYKNRGMQRLLIWELSEDNPTTRRTAQLREANAEAMAKKFDQIFKNSPVDFRTTGSILIGGIYYMILHSKRSTFGGIDFSTRKGQQTLVEAVGFLADCVLKTLKPDPTAQGIAQRMKAKGIDVQTIEECTGVRIES